LPWTRFTWFGEGHTLPCDSLPFVPGGVRFTAILFTRKFGAPKIALPRYRGDPITPLWMLPITSRERKFIMEQGAEEFQARLNRANCSWVHRNRPEAI
jgi:hypothetical protein